jgi:hypothetical protein
MARTIEQIEQQILNAIAADAILAPLLTSTSRVSVYRLIAYIVAFSIWTMEQLMDIFRADTDEIISRLKPHSLRWYAEKSKMFQYGAALPDDTDVYDNTGIADDVITASKIVSYAAVVELTRGIRIKVAKTVGTDLGALDNTELDSFKAYLHEVKDAGVRLSITSGPADSLRLVLTVKYNPLVLDSLGARLDGTSPTPVKDAIKLHLKNLPFNGVFSVQKLVDTIQAVEGVSDLSVDEVQTKYGLLNFSTVFISMLPDAGYLRILDADLFITYESAE